MNDKQIEFLTQLLMLTKMKVFLKQEDVLIPIVGIQTNFIEKDSEIGEPVAWLGGAEQGHCAALWCLEPSDFHVMNAGEFFNE